LNALERDLLSNPNNDHYVQQEITSTGVNAGTLIDHFEPGNKHNMCESHYDSGIIINFDIHTH